MAGMDDEKVLNWRKEWVTDVAGARRATRKEEGGRKKMSWLPPTWIITFGPTKCDVVEKVKLIVWK